jgi:three-Cys-motif partner protein
MSKKKDGTVGPWAREKLDALARYLGFYTKVLKNQGQWCRGTIYIDAFAGPGRAKVRTLGKQSPEIYAGLFEQIEPTTDIEEVAQFVEGSPRVALALPDPFTRYIFIERDPKRVAELESLQQEYGSARTIEVREGDANSELHTLLNSGIDWRSHRCVVFLDPFGMHVPWATIEALGKTGAIEVLVNFPMGMAIQRLLVRSGEISPAWQ